MQRKGDDEPIKQLEDVPLYRLPVEMLHVGVADYLGPRDVKTFFSASKKLLCLFEHRYFEKRISRHIKAIIATVKQALDEYIDESKNPSDGSVIYNAIFLFFSCSSITYPKLSHYAHCCRDILAHTLISDAHKVFSIYTLCHDRSCEAELRQYVAQDLKIKFGDEILNEIYEFILSNYHSHAETKAEAKQKMETLENKLKDIIFFNSVMVYKERDYYAHPPATEDEFWIDQLEEVRQPSDGLENVVSKEEQQREENELLCNSFSSAL